MERAKHLYKNRISIKCQDLKGPHLDKVLSGSYPQIKRKKVKEQKKDKTIEVTKGTEGRNAM